MFYVIFKASFLNKQAWGLFFQVELKLRKLHLQLISVTVDINIVADGVTGSNWEHWCCLLVAERGAESWKQEVKVKWSQQQCRLASADGTVSFLKR